MQPQNIAAFRPSHRLVNTEAMAARFPETFALPDRSERSSLHLGDFAKVIFRGRGAYAQQTERMWVQITAVQEEDGHVCGYEGLLKNDPSLVRGLRFGGTVRFGVEHISDYLLENER